jgi:hypothetical protein
MGIRERKKKSVAIANRLAEKSWQANSAGTQEMRGNKLRSVYENWEIQGNQTGVDQPES